jgi:hypothetical protein
MPFLEPAHVFELLKRIVWKTGEINSLMHIVYYLKTMPYFSYSAKVFNKFKKS